MHSPKGRWRRRGAAGAALLRCLAILAVLALLLVLLLRGSGSSPAPRSFRELASSDDAEAGSALHADQGVCPVAQPHTEYGGEPVRWGADHVTEDAAACCAACAAVSVCGAWVFCDSPTGCTGGGERKRGECWLKARAPHPARPPVASSGPTVGWTSGALFTPADAAAAEAADAAVLSERDAVRFAPGNRRVFLDVEVDGVPAGRMEALLFVNDALAPRAASNFLAFARGDTVDALGNNRTWVGARFYRILDQFIDQTGRDGVDTIHGGAYADDQGGLALKHDRPFLLSQANGGPNTNTNHWSILIAPAPHLDGSYTIFGEVVKGRDVARAINLLASPTGAPTKSAVITAAGEVE